MIQFSIRAATAPLLLPSGMGHTIEAIDVNNSNISRAKAPAGDAGGNERRRVAKFIRGNHGNVTIEWQVAPPGYERPVLRIIQEGFGQSAPKPAANSHNRRKVSP